MLRAVRIEISGIILSLASFSFSASTSLCVSCVLWH